MAKKTLTSGLSTGNGLDNEDRLRILSVIDKLREVGVGENVSLPQIAVVGDQSSGKSSLLDGLTGISFPIASDLCTRFATQIDLLRSNDDRSSRVRVTITPGPSSLAKESRRKVLQEFYKEFPVDEFGSDEFEKIFKDAAKVMGVPGPGEENIDDFEKRFADDILKIELSGPDYRHLSVVDIPGLFHNPTKYQTADDKDTIRGLIDRYITDKRTIIMAVLDARNNLANQEVFSMARTADPEGRRTVGIITKCDALQTGDEKGVFSIAQNQVEQLKHGWFVVKNRSTQDIQEGVTIEGRNAKEDAYFSTNAPWKHLPRDRVGVAALKPFLGNLLYDHIRNEFPSVTGELQDLSTAAQKDLDQLGPSRQNVVKQRRFLTTLASNYQDEVTKALTGNYHGSLTSKSALKLRMHTRDHNDAFEKAMRERGHALSFEKVDGSPDPDFKRPDQDENNSDVSIRDWIRRVYRESRGSELPGTVNPAVYEMLFRQQSEPWKNLALLYLNDVEKAVRCFNEQVLRKIVPDEAVRSKLQLKVSACENQNKKDVRVEMTKILNDERGGILQTVNHYYADNLNAARCNRTLDRLYKAGYADSRKVVEIEKLLAVVHLSNEDQSVNDIHDVLKAYYKVAVKRFMDNVVIEVVERHVLGNEGPVKMLHPHMVSEMSDEEITQIAGESFATARARQELTARVERFNKALEIASQVVI